MWEISDKRKVQILIALMICFVLSIAWKMKLKQPTSKQPVSQRQNAPVSIRATGRDFKWNFASSDASGSADSAHPRNNLVNEAIVPPDTHVKLEFLSDDYVYFIRVDELQISEVIVPGIARTVEFQTPQSGQFDLECSPICGFSALYDPLMGRLRVR